MHAGSRLPSPAAPGERSLSLFVSRPHDAPHATRRALAESHAHPTLYCCLCTLARSSQLSPPGVTVSYALYLCPRAARAAGGAAGDDRDVPSPGPEAGRPHCLLWSRKATLSVRGPLRAWDAAWAGLGVTGVVRAPGQRAQETHCSPGSPGLTALQHRVQRLRPPRAEGGEGRRGPAVGLEVGTTLASPSTADPRAGQGGHTLPARETSPRAGVNTKVDGHPSPTRHSPGPGTHETCPGGQGGSGLALGSGETTGQWTGQTSRGQPDCPTQRDAAYSVSGDGRTDTGPRPAPHTRVSPENKGPVNGEAGHLLAGTGFIRRNVRAQRA